MIRRRFICLPLNGDITGRYVPGGKAAAWRTRDGGASWEALREGLPQRNVFFGVLRQALAADRLEPADAISAPIRASSTPAPTRATAGIASPNACP